MKYTVEGASVPLGESNYDFPFKPRQFQSDFLDWLNNKNSSNILSLEAPTGSGKTMTFKKLIEKKQKTLLVYPTNALIQDQKDSLEDDETDIQCITGDTLEKSGLDRRDELLSYARRGPYDAIITNPDILQSIIQGQYIDYNSKLMQFFNQFDAIVYDEYHFYDSFSASGIVLQSKIAVERSNCDIVYSSATGNKIPIIIDESFKNINVEKIDCDVLPPNKGSKFRYEMNIDTVSNDMISDKKKICKKIDGFIENNRKNNQKCILIFNNVRDSNDYYQYLNDNYPRIFKRTEKDNGYDTKSEGNISKEFDVLVTTSKSEVGLNYNVSLLFTEKPYNASSLIQRIGRASRQTKSDITLYNTGSLPWSKNQTYVEFIDNVYKSLYNQEIESSKIQNLMGLRSAYAMYTRIHKQSSDYNDEIKKDLENVPEYNKWFKFIQQIKNESNKEYDMFNQPSKEFRKIIDVVENTFESLNTLRGINRGIKVKYPKGDEIESTEYSLLSTVSQYPVEIEDSVITVKPQKQHNEVLLDVVGLNNKKVFESYYDLKSIYNEYIDMIESCSSEIDNKLDIGHKLIIKFMNLVGKRNCISINNIQINQSSIEF